MRDQRGKHEQDLLAAGMPPGLAAVAAEVCYPGGPLGDDVMALMPCTPRRAQAATSEWIELGSSYTANLRRLLASDQYALDALLLKLARAETPRLAPARVREVATARPDVTPVDGPAGGEASLEPSTPDGDTAAGPAPDDVREAPGRASRGYLSDDEPSGPPVLLDHMETPAPSLTPGGQPSAPADASSVAALPAANSSAPQVARNDSTDGNAPPDSAPHDTGAPAPRRGGLRGLARRGDQDKPAAAAPRPSGKRDRHAHDLAAAGMPAALAALCAEASFPGGPYQSVVAGLGVVPAAAALAATREWIRLGSASSTRLRRRLFSDQDALDRALGVVDAELEGTAAPAMRASSVPLDSVATAHDSQPSGPASPASPAHAGAVAADATQERERDGGAGARDTASAEAEPVPATDYQTDNLHAPLGADVPAPFEQAEPGDFRYSDLPGWESVPADFVESAPEPAEAEPDQPSTPAFPSPVAEMLAAQPAHMPVLPAGDDAPAVAPVARPVTLAEMFAPAPAAQLAEEHPPQAVAVAERLAPQEPATPRPRGKLGAGWVPPEKRPPRVQPAAE